VFARPAVGSVAVHEPRWCVRGRAVVLDVTQLEALLTRTFSIGLEVGRGREKVALGDETTTSKND
jgi:hypothetical protein